MKDALSTRGVETLKAAYVAWDEARAAHASALLRFAVEGKRLGGQGSFLLGAAKVAAGVPAEAGKEALSRVDRLHGFLQAAEEKLEAARSGVDSGEKEERERFDGASGELVAEIHRRLTRLSSVAKPLLRVTHQALPGGKAVLHFDRLLGDTPVLLCFLLTGLAPTRYEFFEDESTNDVGQGTTFLYEGDNLRPTPSELVRLLDAAKGTIPLKACLLFRDARSVLWRMIPRGPVAELEVADGDGFRGVLSGEEAEAAAGALLRLKLDGKVEIEMESR